MGVLSGPMRQVRLKQKLLLRPKVLDRDIVPARVKVLSVTGLLEVIAMDTVIHTK